MSGIGEGPVLVVIFSLRHGKSEILRRNPAVTGYRVRVLNSRDCRTLKGLSAFGF